MIRLPGYQIKEEISKSSYSTIFRGTRDDDNRSVIIKVLNREYPSEKELSSFIQEYEIMQKISGDGIIKSYALEQYNNSLAIVMEDIGGETVSNILKSLHIDITEKISLAIKMAHSLDQTHRQGIIHKDVNPSNFIWNTLSGQVKIIDFSISTQLPKETSRYGSVNNLEGTIDYISPEQTGRINRVIDYRTDLYSLGITYYELFTGQLPFKGDDISEIVYCHIAKSPLPPNKINPEVPAAISDIIMKLMSKTAEERYQTALCVKRDLEFCLRCMESNEEISGFKPGEGDLIDRFEIPNKLYGRKEETAFLISGFENAAAGHCTFLFVSGYSGVGKTSLVQEIRKPVTGRKGYFISGKFTQFKSNTPYSGFIQAFQELIRQLLSEPQSRLDEWRKNLLDALGNNGQIILDIIPELEQIIGPQPHLIDLNPIEAQNRFQIVFCEFVRVFAGSNHPLVLFLDDLQWSDASSLDLLRYLSGPGKVQYLFFIGAYRDNEVQAEHPVMKMMEELKKDQSHPLLYQQLILKPMGFDAVNQMIADTLHCLPYTTISLTRLVFNKTNGNAFFVKHLLNSLYLQGSFSFMPEKRQWEYDLEKVEAAEISDSVVDLLVKGIQSLRAGVIKTLKLASCIGNQFDFATLLRISQKPVDTLRKELWTAIEKDLIHPINSNYRFINTYKATQLKHEFEIRFSFTHDRIRQAAYSMLSEDEKSAMHLQIGCTYLETFNDKERTDSLFEIVDHLNAARGLIREKTKRTKLMELNVEAGNKAKKTIAFAAAANYYETAEALLTEEEWARIPDKLYEICLEHASAALLSGDLAKADMLCDRLMKKAVGKFQISEVSNIKVQILEFQGKFVEAIDEIRRSLRLFQVTLPDSDDEIRGKTGESLMKIQAFLKTTPVEELVNLPEMKDPEKLMVMQLLFQVIPPALHINPMLFILMPLMMLELTIEHGISPLSCKSLTDCGMDMTAMLQDYETAYRLGRAAFSVIDRFKAESMKSAVYFSFTFSSYWRAHYKESLACYDISWQKGLETGDMQHASYAIAHKAHLMMWVGKNLNECRQVTEKAIKFLNESKSALPLLLTQIVQGAIQKLQAMPGDGTGFEEKDRNMLARLEETRDMPFISRFCQYNTYVNFILGNMQEAEKWNAKANDYIFAALSDFPLPDHYLFKALILVHKWKDAAAEERVQMKETLLDIQKKMENWKENCPENFAHKYYLLSAEIAMLENQSLDNVVELFNRAMESLGNDDYIQYRALSNELCGKMWMERGVETIAKAYIREACYLYRQWGADRKAALMEKQYPRYFLLDEAIRSSIITGSETSHGSIDMTAILKSTRAISREIKIEKLLTILIRTMIENAGAQRGCLLLMKETDNQLYIEAMQGSSPEQFHVLQSLPFAESDDLCPEIVQYSARTGETVVIDNALHEARWQDNPYIIQNKVKSVLCMPVVYQNRLKGIVYLENNLSDNVFTSERLKILQILSAQASISIENARLYENMEEIITERTNQLNNTNIILKELSYHDPLTNLYNRRYIFEIIANEIGKFIQSKKRALTHKEKRKTSLNEDVIGIFLLDIDYFKEVNDTYGHMIGDQVLIQISKILKQMIRRDDSLVRWGGEEFLIILYNTKPEFLKKFARKVVDTIRDTPITVSVNRNIHKTCSLGFVEMPVDKSNPELLNLEQMINLSDYALYCAKENGRNCAAQFILLKQTATDENIEKYLRNLSRTSEANHEYFKIELV